MANSTKAKSRRKSKPKAIKPAGKPDFPLFGHKGRGHWVKKVCGKLYYFGKIVDDPQGVKALDKWLLHKDYLLAGRGWKREFDGCTVEDLCDHFLNAKRPLVVAGELAKRTYDDYFATGERLTKAFGLTRLVDDLRPDDFDKLRADVAKQWGPVRLGNEIQRVRTIFKYGFEAGHIDKPVRFGPTFKKPARKVLRKHRAAKGSRMIEAADLRALLAKAGVPLKSMILLALNGGLGNSDVGQLPLSAIDLERGWINYPRPKTGIDRRFPLWKETVKALKASLDARPAPKDDAAKGLAFVTKYGYGWSKDGITAKGKAATDSPVTKEFRKLLDELKLHKPGLGFYSLRHVFETMAGDSRDQVAVDHVMGHAGDDMASVYRERISDERLVAVVEHVRGWLFGKGGAK